MGEGFVDGLEMMGVVDGINYRQRAQTDVQKAGGDLYCTCTGTLLVPIRLLVVIPILAYLSTSLKTVCRLVGPVRLVHVSERTEV